MDRNELSVEPRHLAVPSGVSKMIPGPMARLALGANRGPVLHQYYRYLQTDRNELSVEPRHLAVP